MAFRVSDRSELYCPNYSGDTALNLIGRAKDLVFLASSSSVFMFNVQTKKLDLLINAEVNLNIIVNFNKLVVFLSADRRRLIFYEIAADTIRSKQKIINLPEQAQAMYESHGELVVIMDKSVAKWPLATFFALDRDSPSLKVNFTLQFGSRKLFWLADNDFVTLDQQDELTVYQITLSSLDITPRKSIRCDGLSRWVFSKPDIQFLQTYTNIGDTDDFFVLVDYDNSLSVIKVRLIDGIFSTFHLPTLSKITEIDNTNIVLSRLEITAKERDSQQLRFDILLFELNTLSMTRISSIDLEESVADTYSYFKLETAETRLEEVPFPMTFSSSYLTEQDNFYRVISKQEVLELTNNNFGFVFEGVLNSSQSIQDLEKSARMERNPMNVVSRAFDRLARLEPGYVEQIMEALRKGVKPEVFGETINKFFDYLISIDNGTTASAADTRASEIITLLTNLGQIAELQELNQLITDFKPYIERKLKPFSPKWLLTKDYREIMDYAKSHKNPDLFSLIFTKLMNKENVLFMIDELIHYFCEELVDHDFFTYWLNYFVDCKLVDQALILDKLYTTVEEVILTYNIDKWASLIFYEDFWKILDRVEPSKTFRIYANFRLKYFLFDRYCYTDWISDDILDPVTFLMSNLCLVLSGTEDHTATLNEFQEEINFLFQESNNVLPMFQDRFEALHSLFSDVSQEIVAKLVKMGAYDELSLIDADKLDPSTLENSILKEITMQNYQPIFEICEKDKKRLATCKRVSELFRFFDSLKIEFSLGMIANLKKVESLVRLAFQKTLHEKDKSQGKISVLYDEKKFSLDRKNMSSFADLLTRVGRDLTNLRLYLKEKGPLQEKFAQVIESEDLDVVSLMVEELVREDCLEQIQNVLVDPKQFSAERVEKVIFPEALKQVLKEDGKKSLNLSWVTWPSARLEGLRALNLIKQQFETLGFKLSKEDVFNQHDFVHGVLTKVWRNKGDDDQDLNLIELFKNAYKFDRLYLDSDRMESSADATTSENLIMMNKLFSELNAQRIKAVDANEPFKNNQFLKFLKETVMIEMFEKQKLDGIVEIITGLDKKGRKDLAAIYLNQLITSPMAETILSQPNKYSLFKELMKKDKSSQPAAEVINNYVISHTKGEMSFQAMANSNIDIGAVLETELAHNTVVNSIDPKYLKKNFSKNKASVLFSDFLIEHVKAPQFFVISFFKYLLIDHKRAMDSLRSSLRIVKSDREIRGVVELLVKILSLEPIDRQSLGKDLAILLLERICNVVLYKGKEAKDVTLADVCAKYIKEHPKLWRSQHPINNFILGALLLDDGKDSFEKFILNKREEFFNNPGLLMGGLEEKFKKRQAHLSAIDGYQEMIMQKFLIDVYSEIGNQQEVFMFRDILGETMLDKKSLLSLVPKESNYDIYKALIIFHTSKSWIKYFCLIPDSILSISSKLSVQEDIFSTKTHSVDLVTKLLKGIDLSSIKQDQAKYLYLPVKAALDSLPSGQQPHTLATTLSTLHSALTPPLHN